MGQVMMENLRMDFLVDKEPIVGQTEANTKVNGQIIR